jgi:hypothetical protein
MFGGRSRGWGLSIAIESALFIWSKITNTALVYHENDNILGWQCRATLLWGSYKIRTLGSLITITIRVASVCLQLARLAMWGVRTHSRVLGVSGRSVRCITRYGLDETLGTYGPWATWARLIGFVGQTQRLWAPPTLGQTRGRQ